MKIIIRVLVTIIFMSGIVICRYILEEVPLHLIQIIKLFFKKNPQVK